MTLILVLMMCISQFIHSKIPLNEALLFQLVTIPNFDSKFLSRMAKILCLSVLKEAVDSVTISLVFLAKFSEVPFLSLFR